MSHEADLKSHDPSSTFRLFLLATRRGDHTILNCACMQTLNGRSRGLHLARVQSLYLPPTTSPRVQYISKRRRWWWRRRRPRWWWLVEGQMRAGGRTRPPLTYPRADKPFLRTDTAPVYTLGPRFIRETNSRVRNGVRKFSSSSPFAPLFRLCVCVYVSASLLIEFKNNEHIPSKLFAFQSRILSRIFFFFSFFFFPIDRRRTRS